MRDMVRRANEIGVKIIASTDTGYDPDGTLRVQAELLEFEGVGMKPLQIIQSATSLAAELLEVDDHTGKIAEGMDADILVVNRNPLEYLVTLYDPLLIVNNGKVMLNRLEWKIKE
jgi:imidazolonepropionase-like amidohydrolase